ncbi:MAG: rhomboid family intramembrane serine protease [Saprospiraceae bacterium]
MVTSIWEDLKRNFSYGNMVTQLVIINVAVYAVVNLLWVILRISSGWETPELYREILNFFMISSDWLHNLTHPWTVFTYMFLHEGFWHILWNMLFLYWFGRIVGDFIGDRRILPLYLLGGLFGAAVYFVSINIFPYAQGGEHYALGASAAVMAIVVAAGTIAPEYIIRLLFLGDVKLKYIVLVLVAIDVVGVAGDINTGGHFAHLGGAFFGWFFVAQLREGNDWSIPVNRLIDRVTTFFRSLGESDQSNTRQRKSRPGPRMAYKNTSEKQQKRRSDGRSRTPKGNAASDQEDLSHQEKLDAILDKIKRSGYDSLSGEEKQFLFNASNKD